MSQGPIKSAWNGIKGHSNIWREEQCPLKVSQWFAMTLRAVYKGLVVWFLNFFDKATTATLTYEAVCTWWFPIGPAKEGKSILFKSASVECAPIQLLPLRLDDLANHWKLVPGLEGVKRTHALDFEKISYGWAHCSTIDGKQVGWNI